MMHCYLMIMSTMMTLEKMIMKKLSMSMNMKMGSHLKFLLNMNMLMKNHHQQSHLHNPNPNINLIIPLHIIPNISPPIPATYMGTQYLSIHPNPITMNPGTTINLRNNIIPTDINPITPTQDLSSWRKFQDCSSKQRTLLLISLYQEASDLHC